VTKSEYRAAVKEAEKSRCVVCGKNVGIADRCSDGLYLHVECARRVSALPDMRRGGR